MITIELAFAGLGVGAVAALCGLGLLATYRLTGVLNLAFGGIATLAAYLQWQAVRGWHWPVGLAAAVDLGGVCPAIGWLLHRLVLLPLSRRGRGAGEGLVASVGVLVALLGAIVAVWGGQAHLDAPLLAPAGRWQVAGVHVAPAVAADLGVVVVAAGAFALVLRSAIGRTVRAVVDDRVLAELDGTDADRVAGWGWMAGATLAGTAGVLLAPTTRLDPYGLTLIVLETVVVVVLARFTSVVAAVGAGLALGVAQAELSQLHPGGRLAPLLAAVRSNAFVVVLLAAVVVLPRLAEAGGSRARADPGQVPPLPSRRAGGSRWPSSAWILAAAVVALPLAFDRAQLASALALPALAVVLISIVVVGGSTGQLALGQAGFAGLGGLATARLLTAGLGGGPAVPALVALVVVPVAVGAVGWAAGWPALRRRGLALALTTFAFGAAASALLFEQPAVATAASVPRPRWFAGDHAFYVFESAVLAVAVVVAWALRRGRLGRALVALRDDEAGALACGVDARRLKLLVFAAGAALAGLGGVLLTVGAGAFDSGAYGPLQSLLWFSAAVVVGVDRPDAAVLAAGAIVVLDAWAPAGTSTLAIGCGAVAVAWLPGGLVPTVERAAAAVATGTAEVGHPRRGGPLPAAQLTPAGRRLVATLAARKRAPA